MKTVDTIAHPYRPERDRVRDSVYGCQLEVGDRLKARDVYAAKDGRWVAVAMGSTLDGFVIGPGDCSCYVRLAAPSRSGMAPRNSATPSSYVPDREVLERRHAMGALRAIAHELGVDGPQEIESGMNARIAALCIKQIRWMKALPNGQLFVDVPIAECIPGPIEVSITGPQGAGKSVLATVIKEALLAYGFEDFAIDDTHAGAARDTGLHTRVSIRVRCE